MRWAVILILLLLTATASAQPKPKIAILGLEVASTGIPGKEVVRVAQDYTTALRARAKAGAFRFAPNSDRDLIDEKLLHDCDNEALTCMAAIGAALGTDLLVFGRLELATDRYQVSLRLLDVGKKKVVVAWTSPLPIADASGAKLQDHVRTGFEKLTGSSTTLVPATPATPTPPAAPATKPAQSTCENAIEKADAQLSQGNYAAALAGYEQAMKCKGNPTLVPKAFLAACRSLNMPKAKLYYSKMSAQQQSNLAQICVRQSIDPRL